MVLAPDIQVPEVPPGPAALRQCRRGVQVTAGWDPARGSRRRRAGHGPGSRRRGSPRWAPRARHWRMARLHNSVVRLSRRPGAAATLRPAVAMARAFKPGLPRPGMFKWEKQRSSRASDSESAWQAGSESVRLSNCQWAGRRFTWPPGVGHSTGAPAPSSTFRHLPPRPRVTSSTVTVTVPQGLGLGPDSDRASTVELELGRRTSIAGSTVTSQVASEGGHKTSVTLRRLFELEVISSFTHSQAPRAGTEARPGPGPGTAGYLMPLAVFRVSHIPTYGLSST